MGSLLFLSTIIVTLVVRGVLGSWYRFIVFLIYITGLLVLFGYMLAISANNYYPGGKFVKSFGFFLLGCSILLFVGVDLRGFGFISLSSYEFNVVKMYSGFSLLFYWFIAVLLFIALIIVVNLCYKRPKPLRAFLK